MISSNAQRSWNIRPTNCYASSNAATDLSASEVTLVLKAICFHGISMELSGVTNHGFFELSFRVYIWIPHHWADTRPSG